MSEKQTRLVMLACVFLLFIRISSAAAWEKALLLACDAKDYARLSDEGAITSKNKDVLVNRFKFTVDIETGMIRYRGDNDGRVWEIVQQGNAVNDTVLVANRLSKCADDIIRIRDWEQNNGKITFIKFGISDMITGACVPIR